MTKWTDPERVELPIVDDASPLAVKVCVVLLAILVILSLLSLASRLGG